MIWWVKKVKAFDDVYVATDDDLIYKKCKELNIDVMMTSPDHKTGTDRIGEIAKIIDADLYVNIQGDEPLISPDEIYDLLNIFKDESVYFGTLRQEIRNDDELKANSTVKVVVDCNQDALYLSRSVIPSNIKDGVKTKFYKHIGIYGIQKRFSLQIYKFATVIIRAR